MAVVIRLLQFLKRVTGRRSEWHAQHKHQRVLQSAFPHLQLLLPPVVIHHHLFLLLLGDHRLSRWCPLPFLKGMTTNNSHTQNSCQKNTCLGLDEITLTFWILTTSFVFSFLPMYSCSFFPLCISLAAHQSWHSSSAITCRDA